MRKKQWTIDRSQKWHTDSKPIKWQWQCMRVNDRANVKIKSVLVITFYAFGCVRKRARKGTTKWSWSLDIRSWRTYGISIRSFADVYRMRLLNVFDHILQFPASFSTKKWIKWIKFICSMHLMMCIHILLLNGNCNNVWITECN